MASHRKIGLNMTFTWPDSSKGEIYYLKCYEQVKTKITLYVLYIGNVFQFHRFS